MSSPKSDAVRWGDDLRPGVRKLACDPLLRRSVCAAGQPACPQLGRCTGLSASDREFPALTGRSGTQRARRLRARRLEPRRPGPRHHSKDLTDVLP
jgi:hypothetical protein